MTNNHHDTGYKELFSNLFRLGSEIGLDKINILTENQGMLAENLENWVQQERAEAIREGKIEGELKAKNEVAANLIRRTEMDDQTICEIAELPVEMITELRAQIKI